MRASWLVAVAWLAGTGLAGAQERVAVEWDAPADACPPGEDFVAETEQALGPREPGPVAPLHVDAHVVRRADSRLVLEMVMHFGSGDAARSLVASSCESLVHAGALVVALALAPERPATIETPPPVPQRGDDEHPWDVRNRPPPPPPRPGWSFEAVAQAVLDIGTMPVAAAGFAGGVGLRYLDLHIEGLVLVLPGARGPARIVADHAPGSEHVGAAGDFSLVGGRLGASLDLVRSGFVTIGPTAAFELGNLHGSVFDGTLATFQKDSVHFALAAGARLIAELGPLLVRIDIETLVPVVADEWYLTSYEQILKPPPVGLRAGFALGLHFP